jgi:NTE family protein
MSFRVTAGNTRPLIGLALGGGFARGIAHIGVLRVFERYGIPVDLIAGVSAGAIVAAAYASGAALDELAETACRMKLSDFARWRVSRMALATTDRMTTFLTRLLKRHRFEEMKIPLCAVATDLVRGTPVIFCDRGDVIAPVRSSCAYPGLFHPVQYEGSYLVDGAFSMEMPAEPLRRMRATRVIAVHLTVRAWPAGPKNMLDVITRCFGILHSRTEPGWREICDLVIEPEVNVEWNAFDCTRRLIAAGEEAALAALPRIRAWFDACLEQVT